LGWGVPWIATNHLEGHLLSPLLDHPGLEFPFLSLVVSGGHTTLYLATGVGQYQTLCETQDDAAGEVYDKVARMLGLGYPGGPFVDKLAATGNPKAIAFPKPKVGTKPIPDMSFAGVKSAVRQQLQKYPDSSPADIAASFQATVIEILLDRIHRAVAETGVEQLTIGGGVAANSGLRAALLASGFKIFLPPRSRCTDNAAMIALTGLLHAEAGEASPLSTTVRPRWPVTAF
jgi:N6-L-threonylcarbamoyladenine synthase